MNSKPPQFVQRIKDPVTLEPAGRVSNLSDLAFTFFPAVSSGIKLTNVLVSVEQKGHPTVRPTFSAK